MMELITKKLSFTELNDKITISNQLNSILDAFIKRVDGNFQESNFVSLTDNNDRYLKCKYKYCTIVLVKTSQHFILHLPKLNLKAHSVPTMTLHIKHQWSLSME